MSTALQEHVQEHVPPQEDVQDHLAESTTKRVQRRGDVTKCPVCGSAIDDQAYHCPKCRNYFCFHCRARMLKPDEQLQCVNQDCDYYGKLICSGCDPLHEKDEAPSIYAEPEDGYWPLWLLLALIAFGLLWYYASFLWAVGIAIAAYALGGFLLQKAGLNLFGKERKVEHQRKSSFHSCVCCSQPVKRLQTP